MGLALALPLCAPAAPSRAAGTPSAPTFTSQAPGSLTFAEGALFNRTFSTDVSSTWAVFDMGFAGNTLTCGAAQSGNLPAGVRMTVTSASTSSVLTWSRFFSRGQVGKHCLRVRACNAADARLCSTQNFDVTITKPENQASFKMEPQSFGQGDTQALLIPMYGYDTRIDFPTDPSSVLELVSCAGNTCSPPALPSWIGTATADANGNHGYFITAQPPDRTEGDWVFKARSAMTVEGEANNTTTGANPLTSLAPLRGTVTPGTDLDTFRYQVLANQQVVVETSSDGNGGVCPPGQSQDTIVTVFDGGGSTVLGQNDDISPGVNVCSRVTYTPATSGTNFAQVKSFNNTVVNTYFVRVQTPATTPPVSSNFTLHVVDPAGGRGLFAPAWAADATVNTGAEYGIFTDTCSADSDCTSVGLDDCDNGMCERDLVYGSCSGFDAWHLDGFASSTSFYSVSSYSATGAQEIVPDCSGASALWAPDGTLACRRNIEFDLGLNFTLVDTPEGPLFGAAGSKSNFSFPFAIDARQMARIIAHKDGRSMLSATDSDTSTSESVASFQFVRGGNDLFYDPFGECINQTYPEADCKEPHNFGSSTSITSSRPTCELRTTYLENGVAKSIAYGEGQRFALDLTRLNAIGTISVARCASTVDTQCNSVIGPSVLPTVDTSGSVTWDIPYDTTSGTTATFWRVRSSASPDPDGDYFVNFSVTSRAAPPAGADIFVRDVREQNPLAHISYDPRLLISAYEHDSDNTGAATFEYKHLFTDRTQGKSIAQGSTVQVHPSFEDGSLGSEVKGPTQFVFEIQNRGGQASAATTADVFLSGAPVDANLRRTATKPVVGTDTPYTSVAIPALAAGESAFVTVAVNASDAIPFAGEPWEGGSSALYLKIAGSDADASNDLYGPIFLTPAQPPVIGATFCPATGPGPGFSGTAGCEDVYATVNAVSPTHPKTGDDVTLNVLVTFDQVFSTNIVTRYFKSLASPPTSSTACTAGNCEAKTQSSVPTSPFTTSLNFTTPLTNIQKPANNVFTGYVLLDATDVVVETGGNEANNVIEVDLTVSDTAPTIVSSPTTTATEDVVYAPVIRAADVDSVDRAGLQFSLTTKPTGMTIGAPSTCFTTDRCATINWTPTDAQAAAGSASVVVQVCDQDSIAPLCTTQSYTITLTRVNDAPVISVGSPPSTATEGTLYSHTLTATDEEGAVTWAITGQPAGGGATLTSASGSSTTIQWTPDDAAVAATAGAASTTITVTATDNGTPSPAKTDTKIITITDVTNVNDAPVLGAPSVTSVNEGSAITSDLTFSDADVDTGFVSQTLSCAKGSGSAAWATVALGPGPGRTCRITGTPQDADVATSPNRVVVQASDGVTTTTSNVDITIVNVNDAPTLGAPSLTAATEGSAFTSDLTFVDNDVDVSGVSQTLTCAFSGAHPSWVSLALNGTTGARSCRLTGTPQDADVSSGTSVTIVASDGTATASQTFNLVVNNVNDAPSLAAASSTAATEGAAFTSTLAISDDDVDISGVAQTFTCSFSGGAPAWLSVSSQTVPSNACKLSGTPQDADVTSGSGFTVTVQVSDGTATGQRTFNITVANVNDAPVLGAPSSTSATEGSAFTSNLSFADDDVDVSGLSQTLTCAFSGAHPSWLSLALVGGVGTRQCRLTGTPDDADLSTSGSSFTVQASDGTATASQTFAVAITSVNDAPVLGAPSSTAATEDAAFTSTLSFGDNDVDVAGQSQTLTCSKTAGPAWVSVSLQTVPSRACKLTGTPQNADVTAGVTVTVRASDGVTNTSSSFSVSVTNTNDAPVLSTIGGQPAHGAALDFTVAEGATLNLAVAATDVDAGDTKAFSFDALPAFVSASQNASTGAFTLTPTFTEAGSYLVTFVVTDGQGAADSVDVGITVTNVNRAPVFTSTPGTSVNEKATFTYDANATDADGDTVTFSLVSPPSGMTIVAATGVVTWVPNNGDVGPHSITVRAGDGTANTDQTFTLTVVNVNDPPAFTSSAPTSATEGVAYTYTATAADIDAGATLTFAATTLPSWLSFNTSTHVLSGTPDDPDVGGAPKNNVVLTVSDGIAAPVTQSFTVTVTNVNDAPLFTSTPSSPQTVAEGATLAFTLAASDPDGPSALSFSMLSQPAGSTLNASTGAFSWTPSFTDAGTFNVTLRVTDGVATTQQALTIAVNNTDRPPTCAVAPTTATLNEGQTVTLNVTGADLDGDLVTLSSVSLPAGSSFTAGTGVFSWTPGFADAGSGITASFRATAGGVNSVNCTASLTVNDVNQAPTLGAPSATAATQGALFQSTLTASDVDLATPPSGEVLTFSKIAGPAAMTLTKTSATTVRLDWTPGAADVGTTAVTIRVTDHLGLTAQQSFNVVVANVNDAPSFTSSAPSAATEDAPFSYTATATDPDLFLGDTITFSATALPSWATFNTSTHVLSGTPRQANVGSAGNAVTLRVQDAAGLFATQSFTINVANVNDAPVLNPIGDKSVLENATLSFTVTAADEDGTTPVLSTSALPAHATFNPATGAFSFTPDNAQGGQLFSITFTASDGSLTDSEIVQIAVGDVDRPPVLAAIGDKAVNENAALSIPVSATDADNDTLALTVSFVSGPRNPIGSGATFSATPGAGAASGTFNWTPLFTDAGTYVFDFVATSSSPAASDDELVVITVNNVNRAPVFTTPPTPNANINGTENTPLAFTLAASDADGDALTFDVSPLPAGATINATTGAFAWTPSFVQAGTFNVTLSASDGTTSATRAISLVIANSDRAPVVSGVPATATVAEGGTLAFTMSATDPDGDVVTLSSVSLPPNATFNTSTGAFSFTPSFAQQGSVSATLRASSGAPAVNTNVTVAITVTNVNQPPTLAAPAATATTQGVLFTADLDAADADLAAPGDTLTFTKQAGPAALTVAKLDADTARVSWTPGAADVNPPTVNVTVRVTDAAGAFFDRAFTLSVANVNDAPVLAQPANGSVAQGGTFSATLAATDADRDAGLSDTLTFSLTTAPAGMTVNGSTGAIAFVAGNANVGVNNVTARVTDAAGAFDTKSFTVTVTNVNDAPSFTSSPITVGTQGVVYSYAPTTADPDLGLSGVSESLTVTATTKPAWLTLTGGSGGVPAVLAGTPQQADVGAGAGNNVVLRVQDAAGLFATQAFTINVANVNDAPVLAAIGNKTVAENSLLTFTVSASDVDGTAPSVSVSAGLPSGATFTPSAPSGNTGSGVFSWTPSFTDAASSPFSVTFSATDGSLTATQTISITVTNVNRAPVLDPIGAKSVNEGATLSFTVTGSDVDVGDALAFSATGGTLNPFTVTSPATFNTTTRVFSFTPAFTGSGAAGTYHVVFKVADGAGLFAQEDVTITVVDVNRAPVFTATPPTTVAEDATLSYTATATDADGDALSWVLNTAPTGMTINASTGAISYTPANGDVGPHAVSIVVSDGKGGSATQSFTLTVTNTNDPPTFTSTPPLTASEGVLYTYVVSAVDVDPGPNTLTFSAPTLPSSPAWLTFNAATRTLSGAPPNGVSGTQNVVLRVNDGTVNVDQAFTIVVGAVNDPPVLVAPTPTGDLTVAEGATLAFTIAATDPDSSTITFGVAGLPAGATINATTGAFSYTPGFNDAGTKAITMFASDGALQASRAINIVVTNTDRAPVITVPGAQSVNEGATLTFDVTATDPDGDVITLTKTSGPGTFTSTPAAGSASGTFTLTPAFTDAGAVTAAFRASSNASGSPVLNSNGSVAITIVDVNRAPAFTSAPPLVATEGQAYTYAFTSTDPDGDALTVALVSGPAGVTLTPTGAAGSGAGTLAWTPNGGQTGPQSFTLRVSDARGGLATQVFTVNVTAVNDPPVFTSTPILNATEDQQYAYNATATDPEGDALTFTIVTGPAGLTVGAGTGLVLYTPANADVGPHPVTLRVSDGNGGTATQSFSVTVVNVNDAPVINAAPAPAATVLQDATFTFTPSITDVDVGDTVTLSLTAGPPGMTVVGGAVRYTPGNADVGDHGYTIRAQDAAGAFATKTFTITVVNKNDAPFFTSPAVDATVAEGAVFTSTIFADDIDVGDNLTFSLLGAPAAASLLPSAADSIVLRYAPDDPEVGVRTFTIRVEDGAGAFADQVVRMTTTAVNDAPVLASIGNQHADPGVELVVTLAATDADGDALTFSVQGALPAGASLVGGVFRFTPAAGATGTVDVAFRVSDGVLTDSETITIVIGSGLLPPTLTLPADAVVDEGVRLSATVSTSDPNVPPATPALAAQSLPAGATFSTAAGVFEWVPAFDQAGSYAITFTSTANGFTTSRVWNVLVRNVNRAPTANSGIFASGVEGTEMVIPLGAVDADGDALTFAIVSGPSGVTVDGAASVDGGGGAGNIHFTPAFADVGTRNIRVRITDAIGASLVVDATAVSVFLDLDADGLPDTWEVQFGLDPTRADPPDPDGDGLTNLDEFLGGTDPFVSNAPTAPTLVAPADGVRVDVATPTFSFSASSDPDGDAITYSLVVFEEGSTADAPVERIDGIAVDPAGGNTTGSATLNAPLAENGRFQWIVIATDGKGETRSTETRSFVVDVVNDPPSRPTLLEPLDGEVVTTSSPALVIGGSVDPDGDDVLYRFRLRDAPGNTPFVTSPLVAAVDGVATFVVPVVLPDASTWFWEAEAVDARGLAGPTAGPQVFTIDLENLPPPAPAILSPEDGELVVSSDVTLRARGVSDPEGLPVTYRIELSSTPSFDPASTQIFTDLVVDGSDEVTVDVTLADGAYAWRIRATDGATFSAAASAAFVVDTVSVPPPAPPLVEPVDNSLVGLPVALVAQTVVDADGAPLTYTFELTDAAGDTVIASVEGVTDLDDGADDARVVATFDIDSGTGLVPGQRYGWRVLAVEPDGTTSAPGEFRHFRLLNDNERPLAPHLVSPVNGDEVTTAAPVLTFEAAVDADGDDVRHEVDVFRGNALVFHAEALAAGAGGTVTVAVPELADGSYTWRARGRDLFGPGPFASTAFTIAAGAAEGEGEGEGEGEVGEGEGEVGEGEGEGDPGAPIVTDVGGKLRFNTGCGCSADDSGTGAAEAAIVGGALLALLRRRRRRS